MKNSRDLKSPWRNLRRHCRPTLERNFACYIECHASSGNSSDEYTDKRVRGCEKRRFAYLSYEAYMQSRSYSLDLARISKCSRGAEESETRVIAINRLCARHLLFALAQAALIRHCARSREPAMTRVCAATIYIWYFLHTSRISYILQIFNLQHSLISNRNFFHKNSDEKWIFQVKNTIFRIIGFDALLRFQIDTSEL